VWIHIPSELCPCVAESEESSLDSNWLFPLLEQSVTLRTKHLRVPSLKRACKTKPWIKRLFGQILKPSMAEIGVAKWIASLEDIHASHLVLQEKNLEKKTQDISGQKLKDSSAKLNRQSASLKMSADIYDWDLNKSQMTYQAWVTKLRQACLQRRKLVLLIKERDYSSWPTVIASDHLSNPTKTLENWKKRSGAKKKQGINLHKPLRIAVQELENWPTVVSSDANVGAIISANDTYKINKSGTLRKINKNGKDGSLGLARTVKMWPTVRSSSANEASNKEIQNNNPKKRLEVEIQNWPTPRAMEPGSTSPGYGKGLKNTAINWRTPNASDGEGGIMEWRDGKAAKLKLRDHSVHAVKSWATPTTRDWKDGSAKDNSKTNSLLGRQAPRTMEVGKNCQITLNPLFTNHLMGWPIGWTRFEPVVMAWCHWLQLMRGEFLQMEWIWLRIKENN
jgi:hypothetical protein